MEDIITNTQVHGHPMRKIIPLLVLILIPLISYSQGGLSTESKKAKKLYEKADKKYKERDFSSAISFLEEAVDKDPDFYEAFIRMGSLYNALGQEDSVYAKFSSYVLTAPNPIASVLERLAFMAFDRGQYQTAEKHLNDFLKRVPERASSPEINLLVESLAFAKNQLLNFSDSILLEMLPDEINRYKLQYLPSVTIDNAAMFYTKRDYVKGDEDIVVSYFKEDRWTPAVSVSDRINSPLNEGACSVSADGRTMIFTSCDGRNSLGSCDLYITRKTGDSWSKPKNLGKPVNSIYWESQPSLSADGKTLYFSSNRTGGFGGRDLWVSNNVDGNWSAPKNLGKSINTRSDETTPFIHPNGISLYLSANGYPGMGGYDLYVAVKNDSVWSKPENLGYPINTFKDEVAIVIGADGQTAYFAKEEQKNFEILDSRLVTIKLPANVRSKPASYIVGRVIEDKTSKPLRAEIEVVDLSANTTLYSSQSDSVSGEYYMVLPVGLDLAAYVKKKGYLYTDFHFQTELNTALKPDTIDISLKPISQGETLILKNIYFEVDSYLINDKSLSEIENAFQLLKDNPEIIVEISGHTDNVGSHDYNQKLSELRAKEVHKRLVSKGISQQRISYKGYAETIPLMPNDSDINRKSNRRIEFRVLRSKQ
ncbi:OmpA family protein [Ekhidna sp. To15]|uniref:OmpA family protein n=1 Tax=Ekhidna sp. To15 TaxID=3395267 RepID=UPI003F525F1D